MQKLMGVEPVSFGLITPVMRQYCRAAVFSATSAVAATILDCLEKKGLLTRTRGEDGKRAEHVHVTAKGRTLVQKADAIALAMEQELLGHVTSAEQAMLFELLQRAAVLRKTGR